MNKLIYIIALITVINSSILAQNESDFFTPPSNTGITIDLVVAYNVNNTDQGDDSDKLQQAIDSITALPNGGKIMIAAGTYYFANIVLASNIHLELDAGVTIFPAVVLENKNYSIFSLSGKNEIIHNVQISATSGKFTVDLTQVENINVRVISVGNVNNFLVSDIKVLDNITRFSAFQGGITALNGEWNSPENGILKNMQVFNSHYGYGVVQMQAGKNIFFKNLWGEGGVTLRFETGYDKMNELQVGGLFNLYGKTIHNENGNAAVMISPHATKNGHVEVDDITSVNSGFAVRIGAGYVKKGKQDSLGITPGYFSNTSKVSNVSATYGTTAQLKTKHYKYMPCAERHLISETVNPDAESYSGPSIIPVLNGAKGDGPGYFTVTINEVEGIGFTNLDSFILYEDDAVEDCSTSIDETEGAQIQIFPNPSSTQFNITLEAGGLSSYKIYTLTGALVENGNLKLSSNPIGENLKSGTYLLSIISQLNSITQLIIKE